MSIKNDNDIDLKPASAAKVISGWKEMMMSPKDASEKADDKYEKFVARVYEEYASRLRSDNAMDFDDLIYYTIRLFEQFPEVKEAVNRRWHYVVARFIGRYRSNAVVKNIP